MRKTKYLLIEDSMRTICLLILLLSPLSVQAQQSTIDANAVTPVGLAPEQVLESYLHAIYSRDAESAYALLSGADKNTKSYNDYVQETVGFGSHALSLARALSAGIEIENITTDIQRNRAEIRFDASLPNASDPELRARLYEFDNEKLSSLPEEQLKQLIEDVQVEARSGQLPSLESIGEHWILLLEKGEWRIFENWAGAVRVTFSAATFENLGWEFVPSQREMMAKHGETLHMKYLARNFGTTETTGKARHIIGPEHSSDYLEIVSCFCFLEQTLSPGESVELPLVFRVNYNAPDDLKNISLKYEFYPIDMFPNGETLLGNFTSDGENS